MCVPFVFAFVLQFSTFTPPCPPQICHTLLCDLIHKNHPYLFPFHFNIEKHLDL